MFQERLFKVTNLCLYFFNTGKFTLVAVLGLLRNNAAAANLNVIPLKIPQSGEAALELKVVKFDGSVLDYIERKIRIEEPGEIKNITGTFPIDLQRDRRTSFDMNFTFPENFVLGSRHCEIYAYTNFLGPSIEVDPISKEPKPVELRKPSGCGEQTMITAGPNTYVHFYLVSTKKMVEGSPKHTQSIEFMKSAFNRMMQYRSDHVKKRAWAVWSNVLPSTWLNAFVDKVFGKMKLYYTDMDVTPVCNSLDWLLGEQQPDGHFREKRPPYHREMHGAVGGSRTLTAYVAVSLLETQSMCLPDLNNRIQAGVTTALGYLKNNKNHPTFQRPYALALLTYALALNDPLGPVTVEMHTRSVAISGVTDGNRGENASAKCKNRAPT